MRKEQKQKPFVSGVTAGNFEPRIPQEKQLGFHGNKRKEQAHRGCLRLKLDQYKRELPTSTMSPSPIHAKAAYGKARP